MSKNISNDIPDTSLLADAVDAVFLPGKLGGEGVLSFLYFNCDANDGKGCWEIEVAEAIALTALYELVEGKCEDFWTLFSTNIKLWDYINNGTPKFEDYRKIYPTADFIVGVHGDKNDEMMFAVKWAYEFLGKSVPSFPCNPDLTDTSDLEGGVDAVFLPGNIHGYEDHLYIIYFNECAKDGDGSWEIEIIDSEGVVALYEEVEGNYKDFWALLPDRYQGRWCYCDNGRPEFAEYKKAYPTADFIVGVHGDEKDELEFVAKWAYDRIGKPVPKFSL